MGKYSIASLLISILAFGVSVINVIRSEIWNRKNRKNDIKPTATKTRKKGGPFWFVPGTLPLQTRWVKAAAFRPGFTPGKAPWRVAQQGQEAPRPSPRQG